MSFARRGGWEERGRYVGVCHTFVGQPEGQPRRVVAVRRTLAPEGDVVRFARERLGFAPDNRQEELLRSDAKQGLLNCSRQWGKSTVAAIKAVHRAYFEARSLVVVASPTERQSAEFLLKAREFVRALKIPARGDGHNRISIRLLPYRLAVVCHPSRLAHTDTHEDEGGPDRRSCLRTRKATISQSSTLVPSPTASSGTPTHPSAACRTSPDPYCAGCTRTPVDESPHAA